MSYLVSGFDSCNCCNHSQHNQMEKDNLIFCVSNPNCNNLPGDVKSIESKINGVKNSVFSNNQQKQVDEKNDLDAIRCNLPTTDDPETPLPSPTHLFLQKANHYTKQSIICQNLYGKYITSVLENKTNYSKIDQCQKFDEFLQLFDGNRITKELREEIIQYLPPGQFRQATGLEKQRLVIKPAIPTRDPISFLQGLGLVIADDFLSKLDRKELRICMMRMEETIIHAFLAHKVKEKPKLLEYFKWNKLSIYAQKHILHSLSLLQAAPHRVSDAPPLCKNRLYEAKMLPVDNLKLYIEKYFSTIPMPEGTDTPSAKKTHLDVLDNIKTIEVEILNLYPGQFGLKKRTDVESASNKNEDKHQIHKMYNESVEVYNKLRTEVVASKKSCYNFFNWCIYNQLSNTDVVNRFSNCKKSPKFQKLFYDKRILGDILTYICFLLQKKFSLTPISNQEEQSNDTIWELPTANPIRFIKNLGLDSTNFPKILQHYKPLLVQTENLLILSYLRKMQPEVFSHFAVHHLNECQKEKIKRLAHSLGATGSFCWKPTVPLTFLPSSDPQKFFKEYLKIDINSFIFNHFRESVNFSVICLLEIEIEIVNMHPEKFGLYTK